VYPEAIRRGAREEIGARGEASKGLRLKEGKKE
jgi:hypothetical protein